jgi:hypothetical protein
LKNDFYITVVQEVSYGEFHRMSFMWDLFHVSRVVHNCYAPITLLFNFAL